MIFDVAKRSLQSPTVLITLENLIGDCHGSRMPDAHAAMLTSAIAERVVTACPTSALAFEAPAHLSLNYGDCIGCGRCIEVSDGAFCSAEKLTCCGVPKQRLVRSWDLTQASELASGERALSPVAKEVRSVVGRALNIRQVDAGSCNGCEGEIVALTNPYYDLERFGIHFVASPKHADMLLVTGPVTKNMAEALRQTYEATPLPKFVIAVGACGCGGGIFAGSSAVIGPVDSVVPVDAYIPGCPPTPAMLLSGILQALRHRVLSPK